MFNIAHLLKFVVNFNLIMMSKPKYIVILTGLFCSVVAGGTSSFYSFFPKIFWQGLIFWYDNISLWLGKPSLGQKGDKSKASIYRPVSFTSVSCKSLGHNIHSHLMRFFEDNKILCYAQHDIRKKKILLEPAYSNHPRSSYGNEQWGPDRWHSVGFQQRIRQSAHQ